MITITIYLTEIYFFLFYNKKLFVFLIIFDFENAQFLLIIAFNHSLEFLNPKFIIYFPDQ